MSRPPVCTVSTNCLRNCSTKPCLSSIGELRCSCRSAAHSSSRQRCPPSAAARSQSILTPAAVRPHSGPVATISGAAGSETHGRRTADCSVRAQRPSSGGHHPYPLEYLRIRPLLMESVPVDLQLVYFTHSI